MVSTHHLKPLLHWGSTLQVFGCGADVFLDRLLTKIDHVAGEERLAVLLEMLLIRGKHTIQPWQKLLRTVVGVQDDRDTICRSDCTNVGCTSNSTGNRGLLVLVVDTLFTRQQLQFCHVRYCVYLSGEVGRSTLGHLEDNRCLGIAGSLESSYSGGRGGNILFLISYCQLTVCKMDDHLQWREWRTCAPGHS